METKIFEAPALYGDHHVTEVRRILLEMPGVKDVYASSSFRVIEVNFDPKQVTADQIAAQLEAAGYLGEIPAFSETGIPAPQNDGNNPYYRHTTVYETTKGTVSFVQQVNNGGRPLWPCPGIGVIKVSEEQVGK
jgi:copper chaperone CopZ